MAAATALAVIGIGTSIASFFGGNDAAEKEAQIQKQIFAQQQKIEEQKRLGMELDAQRRTTQQIRNAQQARSVALSNATNQGAAKSSGLEGGYAQIAGYTQNALLGINQNLDIGRKTSDANIAISGLNMELADAKADSQFWAGLGNLGGSITKAAGMPMFA